MSDMIDTQQFQRSVGQRFTRQCHFTSAFSVLKQLKLGDALC